MSNVLPKQARRTAWGHFLSRGIVAASLILIVAAFFAALALVPSYAVITTARNSLPSAPDAAAMAATAEDRAAIAHTQSLLATLRPLSATTSAYALIQKALSLRPAGVLVQHVSADAGAPGTIVFSGTVSRPDLLNKYKTALSGDPEFLSVSIPVAALAGTADGSFTLTLTANF